MKSARSGLSSTREGQRNCKFARSVLTAKGPGEGTAGLSGEGGAERTECLGSADPTFPILK